MQPPFPCPTRTWHNDTYAAIDPGHPENSQLGKTVIITGAVSPSFDLSPAFSLSCSFYKPSHPSHPGEWHWAGNRHCIRDSRGKACSPGWSHRIYIIRNTKPAPERRELPKLRVRGFSVRPRTNEESSGSCWNVGRFCSECWAYSQANQSPRGRYERLVGIVRSMVFSSPF